MLPVKIGSCTNDGTNYIFYEHCEGRVFAQISGREGFYSVDCKSGLFFYCLRTAERVQRFLESRRFAPVYSEKEKCVEFKLQPVDSWEMLNEKNYSEEIKESKFLSDGRICSITSSRVVIWDPISGKEEGFPAKVEFAAVAEYQCGQLLLGDHSGNIYFKGSKIAYISDKKIEQIVVLSEKRILARVVGQVFLINLERLKVEQDLEIGSGTEIADEGAIYHLQNGFTIHRVKGDDFVEHLNIPEVTDFRLLGQTHLLLAEKEKGNRFQVTLWDLRSGSKCSATVCQYRLNYFFDRREHFFPSGEGLLSPRDGFFPLEGVFDRLKYQPSPSNIQAAVHLSDGTIVFAAAGGLFIDEGYRKTLLTELTKGKEVEWLYELPDGALAAVGKRTVQVFQAVLTEKRYQLIVDEGLRALQDLDFESAQNAYQRAKDLCPNNKRHQKEFFEALSVFRRQKHRSVAGMQYAKQLLREVEKDVGISNSRERRYHKYLIVGDGDFTFSEALVKKHPETAEHIVATELLHPVDVASEKNAKFKNESRQVRNLSLDTERHSLKEVEERVAYLKSCGVEVRFGVDAKRLDREIPKRRFQRIRWNFPVAAKGEEMEFFTTLPRFFRAAARMQKPGDKILIGLDQMPDQWKNHQVENPLLPAALFSRYKFIGKRKLDETRFPGYSHQKDRLGYLEARTESAREFIFQKTKSPLPTSLCFSSDLNLVLRDYKRRDLSKQEQKRAIELQTEIDELEVVGKGAEDLNKGGAYFQHYIECDTESGSSSYYSDS
ncbi:MAG: hypothetical protein ChlgKO_13230 [Chlamydiales bacterium]